MRLRNTAENCTEQRENQSPKRRRLGGVALVASLALTGVALEATPAHADTSNQTYTVDVNTAAGGVYARSAPDSSATQRVTGYGVWPGDTVQLICGVTDGTPVGSYNNKTWHFVVDLNNPGEGDFWLNGHYVDSPGVANQLAPGEAQCGENNQAVPGTAPAPKQPWQLPTSSGHDYIDSVQWVDTPSGESLHVTPTTKGRYLAWADPKAAFSEVEQDANLPYSEGMYNQFDCHAELAPPTKQTWNLDTWRQQESLAQTMNDLCNPGGSDVITNLLQYVA